MRSTRTHRATQAVHLLCSSFFRHFNSPHRWFSIVLGRLCFEQGFFLLAWVWSRLVLKLRVAKIKIFFLGCLEFYCCCEIEIYLGSCGFALRSSRPGQDGHLLATRAKLFLAQTTWDESMLLHCFTLLVIALRRPVSACFVLAETFLQHFAVRIIF